MSDIEKRALVRTIASIKRQLRQDFNLFQHNNFDYDIIEKEKDRIEENFINISHDKFASPVINSHLVKNEHKQSQLNLSSPSKDLKYQLFDLERSNILDEIFKKKVPIANVKKPQLKVKPYFKKRPCPNQILNNKKKKKTKMFATKKSKKAKSYEKNLLFDPRDIKRF
jgi:hypothetical protein